MLLGSLRDTPVAGLILHASINSGLHTALRECETSRNQNILLHEEDFFPNHLLIKFVNCPIFIVHGEKDEISPIHHAMHLASNAKPTTILMKYFAKDAGHNNIDTDEPTRSQYFHALREFFGRVHMQFEDTASIRD